MKTTTTTLALLAALAAPFCFGQAQPDVVGTAPSFAKAGQTLTLKFTLSIPSGFHIYGPKDKTGVATQIAVSAPPGFKAAVHYPATKTYQGLGDTSQVYFGKVIVPVKVSVPKTAKGKVSFKALVTMQACNDRNCLVPETRTVSLQTFIK